ncbi:MAG TPA: phospho-N-acetylmuramoyl-pentapeptide-transferase [Verrucomicrobiota bacterium]|nr:phospho-N-acetylmuramoyl-pentapeptide-transferase [Verrucomicrobiota bacterium]HNU52756.1 phospho-N-acetylmuramoyl-pentapeptide-transferase [Verrucomicrobiota bacterium]
MLYYLSQYLLSVSDPDWVDSLSFLRLFRYITFRTAGAAVTALLISLWLGPWIIASLRRLKFGQEYPDVATVTGGLARSPAGKRGTPTMGGLLIVMAVDLTALLWAQWNAFTVLTLVSLLGLAGLGFYDDWAKIAQQSGRGVHARAKLWVQFLLAGFIAFYLWAIPATRTLITDIIVPFYKHPVATGATITGLLLATFTIVGSSNAVNLTDGLDGLAIGCTLIVTTVFLVLTYIAGNARMAAYLQVPYVPGAGELTVICGALFGAGLGFLWFNCHPAEIFMGDTGSLALGGVLGIMAVLIHQPFVLLIAGGVFVVEAASVIIQVGCFKLSRRLRGVEQRVFLMTPLHHHFEKLGWPETKIVTRFYILCVLCAVLALATLKVR